MPSGFFLAFWIDTYTPSAVRCHLTSQDTGGWVTYHDCRWRVADHVEVRHRRELAMHMSSVPHPHGEMGELTFFSPFGPTVDTNAIGRGV